MTYPPNSIVYDRNGHRARYVIHSSQGHVVQPEIEIIVGDDCHTEWGNVTTWYEVFDKAPREKLDGEIAKLNDTLDSLRVQVRDAQTELRTTDAEIKARRDRIKSHEQLAELDHFISGKVTHYVESSYSGVRLYSLEQTKSDDSYRKDFKLLSLFGRSDGNLAWQLNHYYDGSGSWNQVYPCFSLEEAQAKRIEMFETYWNEVRAGKGSYLHYFYESATKQGLIIPDDIKALHKANEVKSKQGTLDEAQKRLDEARVKLAEVQVL